MFREITPEDKELYLHYADVFYHSDAVESPVPSENYEATFNELMRSSDYLKCYIFEQEGKIDEECRGMGMATEFFDYLKSKEGIARLRLEVESDNEGAKRLYERMGFELLPYLQMVIDGRKSR